MSVQLYNGIWGSSPKIPLTFSYNYRRNTTDATKMDYQVTITIGVMIGTSYQFEYGIGTEVLLNGELVASKQMKDTSPGKWSSPITYTTSWNSVSITSGTVPMTIKIKTDAPRGDSSYSFNLYVIPLSTMTLPSSMTLGNPVKFTITKSDSSYLHTIRWTFGPNSGVICERTDATTVTWTPTDSALNFSKNLAPPAMSGTMTFTLCTHNGATDLSEATYTATMNIPEYRPMVDTITVTLDNSANSMINVWGIAVKGYTKFNWTIDAHTYYNGTINNDKYVLTGLMPSTLTGKSGKTETVQTAGHRSPSATVTDTRLKTSPAKTGDDIFVYDYSSPKITEAVAYRCTSSGVADPSGDHLYVKCAGEVGKDLDGRNTVVINCKTRPNIKNSTFSTVTLESDGHAILPSYDMRYSYEVVFTVSDLVGSVVTRSITIPTGSVTFSLKDGGKAAGFGKYPENITFSDSITNTETTIQEVLDSAWPIAAPYAILDGNKASANIMLFDYTQFVIPVESGKDGKICGVSLTKPGHYICIGSIDRTTANESIICSSFFMSDAGEKNQGALYGKTCRSTAHSGGGVMTMGFLNLTSCDASKPISLELWTHNYDSESCGFKGLMVCFRVD